VDATNTLLPPGEEGLVRCRSDYFVKAFAANHPERTADADTVWWYPGDLGRLTDEGILCIGGRTDDVINSGGVKISAPIIDEAIREYPGVKDAGVCGVRGRAGIEEVWIGIVQETEIDLPDLVRWLDEKYAFKASLGQILMVEHIPRNDLGKLQRHKLKEMLLGMTSRALADT
jgi:acyl-coenzyme A synthetase/AMP-(fatty) acid ligase